MSDTGIAAQIADLDLTTKQGIDQANLILAPYVHEKASLDLKVAIHQLENEADPANRYPLIDDAEKAYRAITRTQRALGEGMPPFENAPPLDEVESYEMDFLIDGWMPADCLTMLTGPGGIGKSYLSLQCVAALAMGYNAKAWALMPEVDNPIPDHEKKDPIDIVIASYEETRLEVWKRIKRICDTLHWADYHTLSMRIHYVDLQGLGPAWGVPDDTHLAIRSKMLPLGEYLLSKSKELGARLLVLDPSAAVYGGSDIARESVREFTSAINAWCREVGCATLLIAHPPKTGDDYAGSTDWLGSCRSMWVLRKEERKGEQKTFNWYQLTFPPKNYAPLQAPVFLRKIKEGGYYTPIWTPCDSQDEAEAFYNKYSQAWGQVASTPQENTHDDIDSAYIPEF